MSNEKNFQTEAYQAIVTRHGEADYPPEHEAGMRVPRGGSSCAKCKFLGRDRTTCTNRYFIRWHGSNKIPAPINEYCSDWFEIR
jgi:hypothetical protein